MKYYEDFTRSHYNLEEGVIAMCKFVYNTYNGKPENLVVFTITKDIPHQLEKFSTYGKTGDWKSVRPVQYVALQANGWIVLIGTFTDKLRKPSKGKRKYIFLCESIKIPWQSYPEKYRGLQQSVKYGHYDAKTNSFYLDKD